MSVWSGVWGERKGEEEALPLSFAFASVVIASVPLLVFQLLSFLYMLLMLIPYLLWSVWFRSCNPFQCFISSLDFVWFGSLLYFISGFIYDYMTSNHITALSRIQLLYILIWPLIMFLPYLDSSLQICLYDLWLYPWLISVPVFIYVYMIHDYSIALFQVDFRICLYDF